MAKAPIIKHYRLTAWLDADGRKLVLEAFKAELLTKEEAKYMLFAEV